MKIIVSVESKKLTSKTKGAYILYSYTLNDGDYIVSTNKIDIGARVETWYDEKWQTPRIRAYKPKR